MDQIWNRLTVDALIHKLELTVWILDWAIKPIFNEVLCRLFSHFLNISGLGINQKLANKNNIEALE